MKKPVPDEVILGLLRLRPMHGYELLECFRKREHLGRIWTMSTSQIYAVLKRLEEKDTVVGKQINEPNVPSKTVYTINSTGIEHLEKWLYDPKPSTSIHLIRVIFISRLYIATLLNYKIDQIIQNQRRVCAMQLTVTINSLKDCKSPLETLTANYVIRHLETTIVWLEDCRNFLP